MRYQELNGTAVGNNLMELMIYANTVTSNYFGLFLVVGFFLVTFIGSVFAQLRFGAREIKPQTSLLASSFATLGWATILEMYSGLLSPIYFFFLIGITILSILWVALGD